MTNYILQPFGIGDHIFTQTLVRHLAGDNPIIWGVAPQFVEGLQRAYPDIMWIDVAALNPEYQKYMQDTTVNGVRVIPIRHANTIRRVPYRDCMRAKYDMYGLDWQTWRNTPFMRDSEREDKLFELLELKPRYRLINQRFRSDESGIATIEVDDSMQNIIMERFKGFSLFDWAKVIENATEIHTVGTGLSYIIELLDLTANEVHCYKRLPDEDHYHNYDYILQKHKYIFH